MKKNYWLIVITYIVMQFSSILGVPLLKKIFTSMGVSADRIDFLSVVYWIIISFFVAFLITLFLLRHERFDRASDKAGVGKSIVWAIGGIFLALFAQSIAGNIERILGVPTGSENTQQILKLINAFPAVIFVSSVLGPILEEIVFRKILFGSLYKRMNFFFAALISSVVFSIAHAELEHTLLYAAMGFTFAFLYVKTKRIIVPIFAHVAMNTLVVLIQSVYKDEIIKYMEELEKVQSFIGGLL